MLDKLKVFMNQVLDISDLKDTSNRIKIKREGMGLTQAQFAMLLGMKDNGERTVSGWERGEHHPSPAKLKLIEDLPDTAPFRQSPDQPYQFTFIDLFAGVGGIRLPFQQLGGKCVFTSEWDKFSQKTYAANFGELPHGDITKISAKSIPEHNVMLAGFPCQAFSQAGLKKGFYDTRGTMFFEIQRILALSEPDAFLLENVKQLKGHNRGETLKIILDTLRGEGSHQIPDDVPMSEESRETLSIGLNYWVDFKVLRAADFGCPQNRERIFIVGFRKDRFPDLDFDKEFVWPEPKKKQTKVGDILLPDEHIDPRFTISERLLAGHERRKIEHARKGNGFGFSVFKKDDSYTNTLSARYYKDGSEILIDQSHLGKRPRKLTPRECANLQGFPEDFIVDAVSDVQAYKQFGNSVSVPVVRAVADAMVKILDKRICKEK
jgi:DNA (cytosine-5)-methyltransferase 1